MTRDIRPFSLKVIDDGLLRPIRRMLPHTNESLVIIKPSVVRHLPSQRLSLRVPPERVSRTLSESELEEPGLNKRDRRQ